MTDHSQQQANTGDSPERRTAAAAQRQEQVSDLASTDSGSATDVSNPPNNEDNQNKQTGSLQDTLKVLAPSRPATTELREAIEEILRPDRTDYFVKRTTDQILDFLTTHTNKAIQDALENAQPPEQVGGKQVDNRFEIAMRGGKKKVYYEILSRYKNGESLEHIKNVAQRSVRALDKQISQLTQVNDLATNGPHTAIDPSNPQVKALIDKAVEAELIELMASLPKKHDFTIVSHNEIEKADWRGFNSAIGLVVPVIDQRLKELRGSDE